MNRTLPQFPLLIAQHVCVRHKNGNAVSSNVKRAIVMRSVILGTSCLGTLLSSEENLQCLYSKYLRLTLAQQL